MILTDLTDTDLARVIHEANRGLNIALGTIHQDDPFDVIEPEHKDAIVDRVRAIRMGLPPGEVHQRYVDYWTSRGWAFGPKDPEKKTHPSLRRYENLPVRERQKVLMACRIVYTLTLEGF